MKALIAQFGRLTSYFTGRGIGVGAYSERCEQFHDKYWRKNVGLCGDYNYY